MRSLLRSLLGLLLSAAFVVMGSVTNVAHAAEGGSFTFSVKPVGTIDRTTSLVEVTVTYSCTAPSGYAYDQSEIDIYLHNRTGQIDAYLYFIDGMVCDGQTRTGIAAGYNDGTRSIPTKTAYPQAVGYVGFTNAYGDYVQLDYGPLTGSLRLRLAL